MTVILSDRSGMTCSQYQRLASYSIVISAGTLLTTVGDPATSP